MEVKEKRITNPDELPMLLTPTDIMDALNISRNRVYQLVHRQDFPAIMFGKQYRVRKEKFLAWLDKVEKIDFEEKETA